MEISNNSQNFFQEQTPEENNIINKVSKNDFSDSSFSCDNNMFQNISTKTRSENKNYYISNIKEQEKNSLCRKIDFSMEIESNDSKELNSDEKDKTKNNDSNFSIKEESNNSLININNKISGEDHIDEEDDDEELDLRLIQKQSSKLISLNNSKFDEDYVIIKTLSEGENGKVFLCMKIQDNKTYVVKMSTSFTRKIDFFNIERLIRDISKNKDHKCYSYIHKYNDCWIEDNKENNTSNGNNLKTSSNKKIIYMVSNYCPNGNLIEFIQKIKNCKFVLNTDFYWDIIFQMIISVAFLHKLGYIHLDIKPSNYLVNKDGELQLTDFSLTVKENEIDKFVNDYEGDSKYISPEMFYKQYDKITHKTDIFSLGLSIYEILSETELPLNGDNWQKIRKEKIPNELVKNICRFDDVNNNRFIQLITIMTKIDSFMRPDIEIILQNEESFPDLNKRYKLFENSLFNLSYNVNKIPNLKCPKYDYSSKNNYIKDLFIKRSYSMKLNNL